MTQPGAHHCADVAGAFVIEDVPDEDVTAATAPLIETATMHMTGAELLAFIRWLGGFSED